MFESSPVRSIENSKAGRRNKVNSAEQSEVILGSPKDELFRNLLVTC